MELNFIFFFNSMLLGIGLAMDAFSVSLANGLSEPAMKEHKVCSIAAIFAVFQALMPLIGWFLVHTIVQHFRAFEKLIPWIALGLLGYIGVQMLLEGMHCTGEECEASGIGLGALFVQGIATSIDALSVGFTIADYGFMQALLAACIIAIVTFVICFIGVEIGKQAGTKLACKANVFGGVILIFIGIEIFVTSFF